MWPAFCTSEGCWQNGIVMMVIDIGLLTLRKDKTQSGILLLKDRLCIFGKNGVMKGTINIAFPESLANSLRMSEEEFGLEVKTSSLVKLYELGKVSSGVAASVLGLSRLEFLELLSKYKVSVLGAYDLDDLKEDIANA